MAFLGARRHSRGPLGCHKKEKTGRTTQPLNSWVNSVDKLKEEVVWLQGKFKDLLEQQQKVLVTLSEVLTRLDAVEGQVNRPSFRLDGPGPLVPGAPEDDFDFRGPPRFE